MKQLNPRPYLVLLFLLCSVWAFSQEKTVTGKVTNLQSEPMESVTVSVRGKNTFAVTNAQGMYSISAASGSTLVFTFTGYEAVEEKVGESNTIDVVMLPMESKMDEVVIIGYGTAKRSKITSSVSKLDNEVLASGLRANPAQALSGTIPGLRVVTGSGRPGSLPNIILRGGTNFDGSGSPLIIMDGQVRNSLSDINPDDIASMEVLKDASATAIYGARASNGVILITSKRGRAGTSSISLNVKNGTSFLNVPYKFLSAEDYIKWSRLGAVQAIKNGTLAASNLAGVGPRGTGNFYKDPVTGALLDGNYDNRGVWSTMRLNDQNKELLGQPGWKQMKDVVPTGANGNYDPNGSYADLIYKDFNYGDYGLHKTANIQDYNLGMTGGNDKGAYYASVGLYDEGGLSLKTFYKRLSFMLNGDYKIKDWLKSESSLQFNRANWRDQSLQNGEANYWGRMLSAPPTMRDKTPNGDWILGRDANDGNPLVNIDKYKRSNQTDKFTFGQAFKVDLMTNLYVRLSATWMYDEGFYEAFNKDFRTGFLSLTDPNKGWDRSRSSSASFDRTIRQTYDAVANYSTSFLGKNNLDAMVGFEYYDAYSKGVAASGGQAPTDDFQDLQYTLNNALTQTRGTDSYHNRDRIMSGFGRLLYDYDGRYLASFTIRRDGVSRLVGDNEYGNFPAASIGWMVHREDFMSSVNGWLSYLKLRASWGLNGNIGIGTSNAVGLYEVQGAFGSTAPYNGQIGFLQTQLANPTLRWEKSNTTEVGADMGFLNNRINFTAAYYNRITDDKLTYVDLPTSSGVSSIRTNNGSMRNRGVETELGVRIIQNKDWSWQVNANASWNKNIILKLPYNGNEHNRQGGTQIYDPKTGRVIWVSGMQEGQEWGEIFGFVAQGIIRNDKDLAGYNKLDLAAAQAYDNGGAGKGVASQKLIDEKNLNAGGFKFIPTQLGDVMWMDVDKNDTIDYRDRVSLGRTLPRWTGGFHTTVSYKRLSLFARIDFALGHVQRDFMQQWSLMMAQGEFNATDIVKDTWTPDNPNARYPRYVWADQLNMKNFDRPSSMFYVNSGYLAFREVTLSYSIPPAILSRAKISGLRLSVTGQNLGYLTNPMLNLPERTGNQTSAYTIPTQLVLGANLTF